MRDLDWDAPTPCSAVWSADACGCRACCSRFDAVLDEPEVPLTLEREARYALRELKEWPALRHAATREWLREHLDLTDAELTALAGLYDDGHLTLPQAYRALQLVGGRA